jgi:hypothetical protein
MCTLRRPTAIFHRSLKTQETADGTDKAGLSLATFPPNIEPPENETDMEQREEIPT